MTELRTHAEDLHEQFSDHLDVTVDEIEDELSTLVEQYRVPVNEATRSVTSRYLEEAGLERDALGGGSTESVPFAEIDQDEQWLDVEATVVELWEPRSDSIAQVGLLGDPSGRIKFVKWETSELPELEEGGSYRLRNVVTDEYEGDFSIKLNSSTTIEALDEAIEVGDDSTTIEGALIDIQSGSGLIKRCPVEDCTRVLQNGRCSEHGEVDGEFDLRIKAVVDDGLTPHEVIFDREATEALTGITLEAAQEMAQDALDTAVVADRIAEQVLGSYYRITGPTFRRYVLADEAEELGTPAHAEDVLIRARSM